MTSRMRPAWYAMALYLVGAACGQAGTGAGLADVDPPAGPTTTTRPATIASGTTVQQTIPVRLGDNIEGAGAVLGFHPTALQAHAGDTIEFLVSAFNVEPHTVTFGTLVEPGLNTPEGSQKLPWVYPSRNPPEGVPQPNQSGLRPCYLDTALPPASPTGGAPPCEPRSQPDFTGTQSMYSSGILFGGESFRFRIAPNTKPGSYPFMCLVHGGRMAGQVTVVEATTPVPPAAEVEQRGKQEAQAKAAYVVGGGRNAPPQPPGPNAMIAGIVINGVGTAYLAEFLPTDLVVPRGTTVGFGVVVNHTITFNALDDDVGLLRREPDGSVRYNPKAFSPANSPDVPANVHGFTALSTVGVVVDGGEFDGTGFKSSGLLDMDPPGRVLYKVTFTKPGVYPVRCLVHANMRAQVTVT